MRIDSLDLKNFRCFESLDEPIKFHPQMNVIAANNGAGKSSILDAITVALSPYANHFEHGDSKNFIKTDATLREITRQTASSTAVRQRTRTTVEGLYPVCLDAEIRIEKTVELEGEEVFSISRQLNSAKGRATTKDAQLLKAYARSLHDRLAIDYIFSDDNLDKLPVISYYGTGRLHAQKKLTKKEQPSNIHNPKSRTMGYLNCLSSESTYKHFFEWMKKITYSKLEESQESHADGYPSTYTDILSGVQDAVNTILSGLNWMGLHFSVKDDQLMIFKDKQKYPLTVLSDGLRSAIAMVGDLAYRCMMLNPQLEGRAALETPGIVLIDEIEMHLHPSWQQQILGQLQKAFPEVQFICTTHSPQVLSSVKPECILIIPDQIPNQSSDLDESEETGVMISTAKTLGLHTFGVRSNFVLEDLMNVSPSPELPEVEDIINKAKALLRDERLTLEGELMQKLESILGHKSPVVRNLKASIITQNR